MKIIDIILNIIYYIYCLAFLIISVILSVNLLGRIFDNEDLL